MMGSRFFSRAKTVMPPNSLKHNNDLNKSSQIQNTHLLSPTPVQKNCKTNTQKFIFVFIGFIILSAGVFTFISPKKSNYIPAHFPTDPEITPTNQSPTPVTTKTLPTASPTPITLTPTNPAPSSPTPSLKIPVKIIIFNPKDANGVGLIERYHWNQPILLTQQYINFMKQTSDQLFEYTISSQTVVEYFPTKKDGFIFTNDYYDQCQKNPNLEHCRDLIDYNKIMTDFNICQWTKESGGKEVWLFGGPWMGFWEWSVKGPNISLSAENLTDCGSTITVMGFSYERLLSEMVHDFGHRTEGVLNFASNKYSQSKLWNKFVSPTNCGDIHYPPNTTSGYNYSSQQIINSTCDQWYSYPILKNETTALNCETWGCSDLGYYRWWLKHLPKSGGVNDNMLNNWWLYLVDFDQAVISHESS